MIERRIIALAESIAKEKTGEVTDDDVKVILASMVVAAVNSASAGHGYWPPRNPVDLELDDEDPAE